MSLRGAKRRGNLAVPEWITGKPRRKRNCLPEIAPQGHFLALRAQGATAPSGPRNDKAGCFPHSSFFSLQDSFISVPRPYSELPGKAQKKLRSFDRSFMLALPIFPCSHPQSIVGANELNFCVRDGNRCTLTAINTNYLSVFRLLPENIYHYTTARLPCQALFW